MPWGNSRVTVINESLDGADNEGQQPEESAADIQGNQVETPRDTTYCWRGDRDNWRQGIPLIHNIADDSDDNHIYQEITKSTFIF